MNLQNFPPPTKGSVLTWINAAVRVWRHNKNEIAKSFLPYLLREQVTENRWLGKEAIFQKTIAITETFCDTNGTNIAHGITGFKEAVRFECRFFADSIWQFDTGITVDSTNITSVVTGSPSFTGYEKGYVTLWYTKV